MRGDFLVCDKASKAQLVRELLAASSALRSGSQSGSLVWVCMDRGLDRRSCPFPLLPDNESATHSVHVCCLRAVQDLTNRTQQTQQPHTQHLVTPVPEVLGHTILQPRTSKQDARTKTWDMTTNGTETEEAHVRCVCMCTRLVGGVRFVS